MLQVQTEPMVQMVLMDHKAYLEFKAKLDHKDPQVLMVPMGPMVQMVLTDYKAYLE